MSFVENICPVICALFITIWNIDLMMCSSINQANHRFTTTMQRRIYGHATNVEIRPLNEEKAVQAAADLVGELFVFTVVLTLSPIIVICIKD